MTRRTDPLAVIHRQWRPRYESRPYRMNPGRREFIHGRIQPANDGLVRFGRRIPSGRIAIAGALFAVLVFAIAFAWPLLGHAASDVAFAPASGTTATSSEAGGRPHG